MPGLSLDLYRRCLKTLLRCEQVADDRALQAVFVVQELAHLRDALPQAANREARASAALDYVLRQRDARGDPALPLFLTALRDYYPPAHALHKALDALAQEVAEAVKDTPPLGPPIDPAALAAYLEVIREHCRWLETRPYRQLSEVRGAPPSLTLLGEGACPGTYVPLRFDLHRTGHDMVDPREVGVTEEAAPARKALAGQRETVDIPLAQVLDAPGHLVFLGKAGSGKTTVLRLVAAALAAQDTVTAQDLLRVPDVPLPIPVFTALREFDYACQTQPRTYTRDVAGLLRFMDAQFQRRSPGRVPPDFVSGLVRGGQAWILLDALDEVADFDQRIQVRETIENLASAFPGNRLLVTARVAAYNADVNTRLDRAFNLAYVRDLTRDQWAALVQRLYAGLERNAALARERADKLLARIQASDTLQEMVKTPLMVWTATLIHYVDRELPEQRAELYQAYVDVLLGARLQEEDGAEAAQALRDARWPAAERRLYLTYAAFKAHEGAAQARGAEGREDSLAVVDEDTLAREILAPMMEQFRMLDLTTLQGRLQVEREARDFLKLMTERSGLLHAHPEGYTFGDHLTLQEFLAALYLVENYYGQERVDFLTKHVGQSWWREVTLLMAGSLLQNPRQAQRFLLQELGHLPGEGDVPAYGLAWAGEALLEIPPKRVGWHAGARATLARRILQVLWRNPPATSVAARVAVGDVLGRLGAPRFQGDVHLPAFIPLTGGEFWMGTEAEEAARIQQETDADWIKDELPRHKVIVDAFALAQVPTTHAMFACFMADGGYREARWWADAPEGFWRPNGTIKDYWGDERSQPAYWEDARFSGPSQPVVGVTWYEAVAYCRWLTATLNDGYVYSLPTEAEWARAARGTDARHYAWGDAWEPGRANTEALNLERTTPVGIFPDGATPEGLWDMTGNVWEWCQDWYDEVTYRERAKTLPHNPLGPDNGGTKVLRGGSWYNDRHRVRCAYRGRYDPDFWDVSSGFRVARGSLK